MFFVSILSIVADGTIWSAPLLLHSGSRYLIVKRDFLVCLQLAKDVVAD